MELHPLIIFSLRQAIFIIPFLFAIYLFWRRPIKDRVMVSAFFAFLFQFGLVFSFHLMAVNLGWWSFGGDELKLLGFPADIWIGGAILWGPVLYLAFSNVNPLVFVLVNLIVNIVGLPLMSPVISVSDGWFLGQMLVVLFIMVPGQYLARWTEKDINLPYRATLLSFAHATIAFLIIPSAIMKAMGGSWSDIIHFWPSPVFFVFIFLILLFFLMGLSAVQLFVVHGKGTPIPLDNTKELVCTGLYAYLRNPMQTSTASIWFIMGCMMLNIWITLAALMAVVFVLGLVRWHHRYDMEKRFPTRWNIYRTNVPEWLPRWRPWVPDNALLVYDPKNIWHKRLLSFLSSGNGVGIDSKLVSGTNLQYKEPNENRYFTGLAAYAKALNHTNFIMALAASLILLLVLTINGLPNMRRDLS